MAFRKPPPRDPMPLSLLWLMSLLSLTYFIKTEREEAGEKKRWRIMLVTDHENNIFQK